MQTRIALGQIVPGLYTIRTPKSVLSEISALAKQSGHETLILPPILSDYLIGQTVQREFAFDEENRGTATQEIEDRLHQRIGASPFSGRENQLLATLSGGEQQMLVLHEMLDLSPSLFIVENACDYLSADNYSRVHLNAVSKDKVILNFSSQSPGSIWNWEDEYLVSDLDASQPEGSVTSLASRPRSLGWSINARNYHIGFESSSFSLDLPDWHLEATGPVGMTGANGSGKSTIADCLGNLTTFDGTMQFAIGEVETPRVGYLTQMQDHPTHGMTAMEILDLFTAQERLSAERKSAALEFLEGSETYHDLRAGDITVGRRMIVSLALLIGEYDAIILDEPTYALPPMLVANYFSEISTIFGQGPLLLISHDSKFLSQLCQTVIMIDDGEIKYKTT